MIPSLAECSIRRKGNHGKVLIVGGSAEYSGAPLFAGLSSLRTGADLCWIACSPDAALAIKSQSPDLIVVPYIPAEREGVSKAMDKIRPILERVNSVVIGPGLGRSDGAFFFAASILEYTKYAHPQIPVVVDGDALFLLSQQIQLIQGHRASLLTPNAIEWDRISGLGGGWEDSVTLRKGSQEIIGGGVAHVGGLGSPRRCGGQGDILAGAAGTFLAWARQAGPDASSELSREAIEAAAVGASLLTRQAAADAFADMRRGMLAQDILRYLPQAFEKHFPSSPSPVEH